MPNQVFSVFCNSGYWCEAGLSIQEACTQLLAEGDTPIAWMEGKAHPQEWLLQLANSVDAGRVIRMDGKVPVVLALGSPLVESEKGKEQKFKIGGHYRNRQGDVVHIGSIDIESDLHRWQKTFPGEPLGFARMGDKDEEARGYIRLNGGGMVNGSREYDLIPGELHEVNGEWLPIESSPTPEFTWKNEGKGEREPTYVSAESIRAANANFDMEQRDLKALEVRKAIATIQKHAQKPQEPRQAAANAWALASPDLQKQSHLVLPVHGSAALLKVR